MVNLYAKEQHMRYMLLIYDNEKAMEGKSPEEMEEQMGAWS